MCFRVEFVRCSGCGLFWHFWLVRLSESILTDTDHKTHWFCLTGELLPIRVISFSFLFYDTVSHQMMPRLQKDDANMTDVVCPRMNLLKQHSVSSLIQRMISDAIKLSILQRFNRINLIFCQIRWLVLPLKSLLYLVNMVYAVQSNWVKTVSNF